MEPIQLISLILGSTVVGGVAAELIRWYRAWRDGVASARRLEVDRALAEAKQAHADRKAAEAETAWWQRWARILEETLAIHRRQMIDAPCIDPDDLPQYPSRPTQENPS